MRKTMPFMAERMSRRPVGLSFINNKIKAPWISPWGFIFNQNIISHTPPEQAAPAIVSTATKSFFFNDF